MNWKPTTDTTSLVKAFDSKQDLFGMFHDALIESGSPIDAWEMLLMLSGNINGDDVIKGYQATRSVTVWRPGMCYLEEIEMSEEDYVSIDCGDADGYEHMNWSLQSEFGVSFENALAPTAGSGVFFFYNLNDLAFHLSCGRGNGRHY